MAPGTAHPCGQTNASKNCEQQPRRTVLLGPHNHRPATACAKTPDDLQGRTKRDCWRHDTACCTAWNAHGAKRGGHYEACMW